MPPLTKSRFTDGLQCPKKLWLALHRKDLKPPVTRAQQRIFDFGHAVGARARELHQGGVLIDVWPMSRAAEATEQAIAAGAPHVYEATFIADGLAAKIDVLSRADDATVEAGTPAAADAFHLTEVKSSTKVKPEHIPDVAFQKIVAERAGLTISGASVMHVDNTCLDPASPDLLKAQSVDRDVDAALPRTREDIARLQTTAAAPVEPAIEIGSHCDSPYECPFKTHCWRDVPKNSIFTIPRFSKGRATELWAAGVCHVVDFPDVHTLKPAQQRYVGCVQAGEPHVEPRGIQVALDALVHPIHFLDFETDALPIQRFPGLAPYAPFPFQYSCHVEHDDGTVEHREFLHEDLSDPRPDLVRRLMDDIGPEGSVVVYNAPFERRVLRDLAADHPDLADRLNGITDRIWDLLPVVKANIDHPEFEGSYSIKKVLPALVPGLTYEGAAVQDGQDAQAAWDEAIRLEDGEERTAILEDVRAYCGLDTLAMVEILGVLRRLAHT